MQNKIDKEIVFLYIIGIVLILLFLLISLFGNVMQDFFKILFYLFFVPDLIVLLFLTIISRCKSNEKISFVMIIVDFILLLLLIVGMLFILFSFSKLVEVIFIKYFDGLFSL